ncbi:hypothetical protein TYRP_011606 [Tyrophagus putrescentiae]|nr:hypothetical protein TYRP_011606 [Tyrophagus putrescentiae]
MSQKNCSVYQCRNTYKNTKERPLKVQFYSFPADPERRAKWVEFVDRVKRDGSPWEPTRSSLICSDHFLGNRKSVFPRSPAFNPSVRPVAFESQPSRRRPKQEPNKDQIDLDEEFDLDSPPNSVATQCNLSGGRPYFKDSTGALAHFASTYSVELLYRSTQTANRKVATLTFNQATQVAHKADEPLMNRPLLDMIEPPPKYQFRELVYNTPSTAVSINTNTAATTANMSEEEEEDQKPTLRTRIISQPRERAANLAKRETQFLATKYAASLKSTETAEEEVPAYAYAPKPPHLQGNLKRVSDQWEARKPIIANPQPSKFCIPSLPCKVLPSPQLFKN